MYVVALGLPLVVIAAHVACLFEVGSKGVVPLDVQGQSAGWERSFAMRKQKTRNLYVPRGTKGMLRDMRGQGTTEYAILVGVLVVIAIIAIVAFRGKVQQLWDAIVSGMNSL